MPYKDPEKRRAYQKQRYHRLNSPVVQEAKPKRGPILYFLSDQEYGTYSRILFSFIIAGTLFDGAITAFLGTPYLESNRFIMTLWYSGLSFQTATLIFTIVGLSSAIVFNGAFYWIGLQKGRYAKLWRTIGTFGLGIGMMWFGVGHFAGGSSWLIHLAGLI